MIGIDEVGRGCWAGPLLVVAARDLKPLPEGLADSKRLSKEKREQLAPLIQQACDIGEGWVTPAEVDKLGLTEAMRLGVVRALSVLNPKPDELIIMDGNINYCSAKYLESQAVVGADALHPIVSAASIHAKVKRDNFMTNLDQEKYGKYEFYKHVGYGTAQHKYLLHKHGVSDQHRRSYKPVAALVAAQKLRNTTAIGQSGEERVAKALVRAGFEILGRNWKTRWCEIDIVAAKASTVCFVEVKYRKTSAQGDGFDYITPRKLHHMSRAAQTWVSANGWPGPYRLLAAAVSGETEGVTVREIN